uniref:DUF4806 domain-containing protein n=1 Tax=Strongyloides papillosus TaxID=174720 RepID=A0A0N5CB73_STREA
GSINTQLEKFMESVKRKEKDETENNERPSGENPFIEGLSILESGNDQIKTSVDKPTIMSMFQIIRKDINTNTQLNENIIRKIKETDYNIYRLSESVEEIKIKLDDLFEIQLTNKNIKKTHSKTLYLFSGTIPCLLMEASNEELKDMVYQMRERCFGVDGKDRIENMRLRKFLDDNTIKKKALEFIQNEGKFCKYVADILIPNSQILKFYFPSEHTRRNKNELFGRDIVKAFMITAKYLGAGIISEFK